MFPKTSARALMCYEIVASKCGSRGWAIEEIGFKVQVSFEIIGSKDEVAVNALTIKRVQTEPP